MQYPEIRTILPTQERILLNAYSQGSPVVAAVIAQLPEELLPRLGLVTIGSPLRRLYGRVFPAYFGVPSIQELVSRLSTSPDHDQATPGKRAGGTWSGVPTTSAPGSSSGQREMSTMVSTGSSWIRLGSSRMPCYRMCLFTSTPSGGPIRRSTVRRMLSCVISGGKTGCRVR